MIKFIFFGRLVKEKWIDLIIEAFSRLHKEWITNWHLEIYGEGPYAGVCKQFAENHPRNILLHWRTAQSTIYANLQSVHYCLMPSTVIESFGMSALESLSMWAPVIGRKIWGLEQFVDDKYDCNTKSLYTILKDTITNFSLETRKHESQKSLEKAKKYNQHNRLEKVKHLWNTTRTLIVSDYTTKIWWVEIILANNKKALETIWSETILAWWNIQKTNLLSLKRKLWLIATAFNLPIFLQIKNKIKKLQPTLIWLHCLNRHIWRFPLTTIHKQANTKIICTIHDLGMFHPFWADVSSPQDLPNFSLKWFMSLSKNPINKLLMGLKFINLQLLKKQLTKKVDTRIVPSDFMVSILHQKRHIPTEKIQVLANFIN